MILLTSILLMVHLLPSVRTINMTFFPCDANGTAIDCSNRQLDRVPLFHSQTVTQLDLSLTKIMKLEEHSFKGVLNLLTLKMNYNCKPEAVPKCKLDIHYYTFKTLSKLEELYLSGNNLSSIPWLPKSLKLLDLQYNKIFQIDSLEAPNLEILFLSKNCFYNNACNQSFKIDEQVLKEMKHLKNLTLAYNNLTTVPKGLPPSLEYLSLKENTITEIPNNTFANLTNLIYLNLEWNCQRCDHAARTCIPCPNNASLQLYKKSLFSESSAIVYLSLRGNSLKKFPEGLFTPLKKLKTLDLSDNLLAPAIQNGTFFSELKNVTWLNLIYNYEPKVTYTELILSPHIAEMSSLRSLLLSGYFFQRLSDNSYEVLSKLYNLRNLDLRMNFIDICNATALGKLPSIRNIDISQNMLKFVSLCNEQHYVHSLFTQTQHFKVIDREAPTFRNPLPPDMQNKESDCGTQFLSLAKFRHKLCDDKLTFNLSANDILYLNKGVFEGMENAVCVDLSFNYMSQALKEGVFSKMQNLSYLDLSYNRFDLYYSNAFSELKSTLKVLDLSNNEFHFNLKGMGHGFEFLQNLTELSVLSLANNKIGMRISKRLISSSINYLFFNGNHLYIMWESDNDIYNSFFQKLTNLTYLDISDNNLRLITPTIWCNFPTSITFLSISRNEITFFPWQNLSTLHNLEHLDLSHNHIEFLPSPVEFGDSFSYLDLSHNNIASLPDYLFSNHKLRCLHLNNNQIKEFNQESLPTSFKNGSTLRYLTLHHNHFRCDCGTTWFADFLCSTPIKIPNLTTLVQCQFPESQQGKSVLHLAGGSSCQDIYGGLAFIACAFLTVMLTALPLLNHLYSWDLWYSFQVLWARFKGYSQLKGSDSKHQYDAFVLFDTENPAVRDWVYNELICHLEDTGHRRFCLCLEERDWIPGLSRIENLHNAIYKSVKTVFVLSCGGEMTNGVIRQAFFMVQQRLLDEKVDTAVLVLLDDMFPKLKYLQLRKRLCRRSVLSWPQNPKAHPFFWNQMRAALSSDNLKFYDKNMSESFA
uniref:Toll-like receptor 9 n=1 Tax=Neogobius melanostomus TaxID=47308 RepID=A0A8C6TEN3_9GOBI